MRMTRGGGGRGGGLGGPGALNNNKEVKWVKKKKEFREPLIIKLAKFDEKCSKTINIFIDVYHYMPLFMQLFKWWYTNKNVFKLDYQ